MKSEERSDSGNVQTIMADSSLQTGNRGLFSKLAAYFSESNKDRKRKKLDFSIIGGPHYSTDTKFGFGLVAAGLYHSNPADSLVPPSNLSIYGDISTVGFYMAGLKGIHIDSKQQYRVTYSTSFTFFPTKFWGVGYEMGNDNSNESTMNRIGTDGKISFLFKMGKDFYMGPSLSYSWTKASKPSRPELLKKDAPNSSDIGIGFSVEWDTRDVMTAPHTGFYLSLSQTLRKHLSGNKSFFGTTDFVANIYCPIWNGATLAAQAGGLLQTGQVTWHDMAMLGNSHSMRGYYNGRYRDKNKLEMQIELRQHIYRRNGLVAWVGAGTVFPRFSALHFRRILPNYGIGYRWKFKKNMNVRLDYGFGKSGQSGFIFNINEAF